MARALLLQELADRTSLVVARGIIAAMTKMIDSHCHLDAPEFDPDREAVLARARAAAISAQVLPAVTARGWPALRTICAAHPDLHPAYGLHPMYLSEHRPEHLQWLRQWLQREPVVAVGECGLDFWIDDPRPEQQQDYLLAQLRLAREFDLPVIVHARRAYDQVTALLRRIGGLRGVVHSFAGSPDQAEHLWRLGFHLGIGGPVTYPRAQRLRELVARMPIEHLLLETDSPDQPLFGHQGQRNEPSRLSLVLDAIAELRGESPHTIATSTTANARRLFALP